MVDASEVLSAFQNNWGRGGGAGASADAGKFTYHQCMLLVRAFTAPFTVSDKVAGLTKDEFSLLYRMLFKWIHDFQYMGGVGGSAGAMPPVAMSKVKEYVLRMLEGMAPATATLMADLLCDAAFEIAPDAQDKARCSWAKFLDVMCQLKVFDKVVRSTSSAGEDITLSPQHLMFICLYTR